LHLPFAVVVVGRAACTVGSDRNGAVVTSRASADKAEESARARTVPPARADLEAAAVHVASTGTASHEPSFGTGRATPAAVMALQRLVGNRGTGLAIQRDLDQTAPVEEAADVATPAKSDPASGARRGWGAMRGVVDESRAFNQPGKQNATFKLNVKTAADLGPERAAKLRELIDKREERTKKTTTAGGAFLASQVNSKEKIGSAAAYTTPEQREGHLGEFFKGAHAFVSNDAYLKIRGEHATEANFNAMGAGSNFVAPLSDANHLVEEAAAPGGRGLFHLEEKLGIPKSSWVNQCKSANYGIWRFKILKPQALNLRIPSGSEYGAYGSWVDRGGAAHRGEWRPGGKTLGGAKEAVIDQIGSGTYGESGEKAGEATRNKLADLQRDGVLKIELDTSMAANTTRALADPAVT
jgi:hypothetical protein